MIDLSHINFYITNYCNYSCTNCNNFNNYRFNGHHYIKDYKHLLIEWSKKINITKSITILGGEPTIHPDFVEYVKLIYKLWPNTQIHISTNGHNLHNISGVVYDILKDSDSKIRINASVHSENLYNDVLNKAMRFLKAPLTVEEVYNLSEWQNIYNNIRGKNWPDCNMLDDFKTLPKHIQKECIKQHNISDELYKVRSVITKIIDVNNVKVVITPQIYFKIAAIQEVDNKLQLHNNKANIAFENCGQKICQTIIKGKLYKCPTVGLINDFYNQMPLNISKKQLQLIKDYIPLTIKSTENDIVNFKNELTKYIPQCGLCSIESGLHPTKNILTPTSKKVSFVK